MRSSTLKAAASGAVLAWVLTGAVASVQAQDDPTATAEQVEDRLVAEVNGEKIYQSEVLDTIQTLPPQVRQMPVQMLVPLVADQLVTGRLIARKAIDAGLQDSEEVQRRLADAERRIVQEVWLNQQIDEKMTEEAIQAAYQDFLAANPPAEEVRARHILVETEEEARDIIRQLEEGGDFAAIAAEKSKDPGASNGGDLGYFTKDRMVEPFAEAAFALEPGTTSEEPVQTQFGWHVIRVEDRRMQEQPTLEQIRGSLEQDVERQIVQDIVAELRSDAEITVYGPDGNPMAQPEEAPAEQ
jgi:peptidyl-prolyl cis-trans isomerase C